MNRNVQSGKEVEAGNKAKDHEPVADYGKPKRIEDIKTLRFMQAQVYNYKQWITSPPPTKQWTDTKDWLAFTGSIEDYMNDHVCMGTVIWRDKILTSCKCTYVFNPETLKYTPYTLKTEKKRKLVLGVSSLCDYSAPNRSEYILNYAIHHPDCTPLEWKDVWYADVGLYVSKGLISTDDVPVLPVLPGPPPKPNRRLREFQPSVSVVYLQWRTFRKERSVESLNLMNIETCLERFNVGLSFKPSSFALYCSDVQNVSEPYRPCFGSEGAPGSLSNGPQSGFQTIHLIVTGVSDCHSDSPVYWTRIQYFAKWLNEQSVIPPRQTSGTSGWSAMMNGVLFLATISPLLMY